MPTIVRAELFRVRLPLVHEFRTSSHHKDYLEHLVLAVTADDGTIGWGECASPADPYYGPETAETCWTLLTKYFLPAVLGRTWATPAEAFGFSAKVRGNHFARAAVDMACWDVWCRKSGTSLASAIGATQANIEAGVSLGIEPTVAQLLEQVDNFVRQGYRRIKLKIAPGWDVEPTEAVRAAHPDIPLQVDANAAYADDEYTLTMLRRLDKLDLAMIEQPYGETALLASARAQAALRTPICLDESILTLDSARTAFALDAARIVNVKVSRLGGITPALALHALCFERGIPVWCGGMHEFGVGRAANVAVAALPGFSLPSDISGSDKYYSRDIVDPAIAADRGLVPVPYDRPGLGHATSIDLLKEHTLESLVIDRKP